MSGLKKVLSTEKISKIRRDICGNGHPDEVSEQDILARVRTEILKIQQVQPALHILELAFRNAVHEGVSQIVNKRD